MGTRLQNTLAFAAVAWVCVAIPFGGRAGAQILSVPNNSFEEGENEPKGWILSGGTGLWTESAADGKRAISVTGTGKPADTNTWSCTEIPFEPFTVYRLTFQAKRIEGKGGCPVSGPVFCNRDLFELGADWRGCVSHFITPNELTADDRVLRFGQWEVNGTIAYDAVSLVRAMPVHRAYGALILGRGERISGREYTFSAPFGESSSNYARPLARFRCLFNTNRWVFGTDSEVLYCHRLGDLKQESARVSLELNDYHGGLLEVETGADGSTWQRIGVADAAGTPTFNIPTDILSADEIWVRLSARPDSTGAVPAFQLANYTYRSMLDRSPADGKTELVGRTVFAAVVECEPGIDVAIDSMGDIIPGGENTLHAHVKAPDNKRAALSPKLAVVSPGGHTATFEGSAKPSGTETVIEVPYEVSGTGLTEIVLTLGEGVSYRANIVFDIPAFYETGYGETLPGSTESVGLWWASSGWKISSRRPSPVRTGKAISIKTARNEAEAAQLVIRPKEDLKGLVLRNTILKGPGGTTIPEDNVEMLRVRYVPVSIPTDSAGVVDLWPDPLPPLAGPLDLSANTNQPLWVRVKPPRGVPAGVYKGTILLSAEEYQAEVPLEVTVFDFDLPDRMTCTTAFGFTPGTVFGYQRLSDPAQQRAVYEKYLAALAAHHISPYSPTALDPWTATWPAIVEWQGGRRDTTEKHEGNYSLLVEDANPKANPDAHCMKTLSIPEKGVRVRLWYKTKAAGGSFLVSLQHSDADGQWMAGKNTDLLLTGTGDWQNLDQTISRFPEGAKHLSVSLFGAPYIDDGSTVGVVWVDDILIEDAETGQTLLDADFEPIDPAKLVPKFDWTTWDAAMERAVNVYHFNAFTVGIPGMGGGTFHSRTEPSLLGYPEDTPQYKAAFANYCRRLEEHLRRKGWLDMSYVYWFDEPDPKDYAFVMNGFRKIKEAAPGIGRMLTEQVEPALVGGPNIWCPLTPAFDPKAAQERRAEGDRFWWYVCTGPKAPYATLFIDHPGTELRVWLWQTWQRRIDGILVWATNYWTSECAYPEPGHPQNPYEDPMSWVSGYDTPAGVKSPWGNGDGRFIYPPEAAADGMPAAPVLEGPVDSFRIEMLRDGIEDYEYMVILDRLIDEKSDHLDATRRAECERLLEVPESVTSDLTKFTTDPAPIEQHREAVARAIEALGKL